MTVHGFCTPEGRKVFQNKEEGLLNTLLALRQNSENVDESLMGQLDRARGLDLGGPPVWPGRSAGDVHVQTDRDTDLGQDLHAHTVGRGGGMGVI